ncbi:MAG: hypothetical protein EOO07_13890 [Chitinophagaceae bacterium]|nr:MAG: hypothetical protein EOO07_13890 [Chitinophagaceae bacterium]
MMKKIALLTVFITYLLCSANAQSTPKKAPAFALGNFTDDYGITYSINDSVWLQNPKMKFHILKWNHEKQYLVAKNDVENKEDANKYTRIDYMTFTGMEPFKWGFCLTVYNAESDEIAEKTAYVDRLNPKKGCNGYPFSRMKRVGDKN